MNNLEWRMRIKTKQQEWGPNFVHNVGTCWNRSLIPSKCLVIYLTSCPVVYFEHIFPTAISYLTRMTPCVSSFCWTVEVMCVSVFLFLFCPVKACFLLRSLLVTWLNTIYCHERLQWLVIVIAVVFVLLVKRAICGPRLVCGSSLHLL